MKSIKYQLIILTVIASICCNYGAFSQVGIGTMSPDASSALDINSTTGGVLAPRMTTAQRIAIANPANGLLVFDITENAFYFYKATVWTKMDAVVRDNYKLIKSIADLSAELTAGGGSKYLLSTNTLYEINGTISLAYPIELNNAYVVGRDANEDKLVKTGGTMFTGTTGGTIKTLTLIASGGTVFGLIGSTTQNIIFRDSIVANSASVGSISGYGMVFFSVIQYSGNNNGITYTNITDLLLSNTAWALNNSGTYETFTGTFGLIKKQGGYFKIDGANIGIDVSSNPTVNIGIMDETTFSGTSTQYVKKYTTGSYAGFNFTNAWTVNCPGIPVEFDGVATGNIYFNGPITFGFVQTITNNNPLNLAGNGNTNTTTAVNLLRIASSQDNRITYLGNKKRTFQINATLSIRGNLGVGDYYAFFIRKNGSTTLTETNSLMRINSTTDISSNAISGTVELAPNEYIEIWGQRLTGSRYDLYNRIFIEFKY
ncbi:hypothetical protein N7U66_00730 [Lacinutrix neustonica]|uniref:Cell wall anchor protein n=1 Tax=Lacinutrix neustonica TaxID=2980107 RepID=A0A9E8MVM1_9FLAO|nr:hypothetical protein [Lacinutrix neustonica]WAC02318.1 hypothetical protein N7U66_00730 [Lacinutrix neustonica]